MKLFSLIFISLIAFISCQSPKKPFHQIRDTVVVAYRQFKKGPVQLYIGAYSTYQKIVVDTESLKGSQGVGYEWHVKIGDTIPDGHGHAVLDTLTHKPVAQWQSVPDSLTQYLQPITVGR